MDVVLEPDATPLVRIIADDVACVTARSRPSRAKPKGCAASSRCSRRRIRKRSPCASQKGRVELARGVASDAQVVVTVDLDNMSGPDAPKPKVQRRRRVIRCSRSACRSCSNRPTRPWSAARAGILGVRRRVARPAGGHTRRVPRRRRSARRSAPDRDRRYEIHGTALALDVDLLRAARCSVRTCSTARCSRSDRCNTRRCSRASSIAFG